MIVDTHTNALEAFDNEISHRHGLTVATDNQMPFEEVATLVASVNSEQDSRMDSWGMRRKIEGESKVLEGSWMES